MRGGDETVGSAVLGRIASGFVKVGEGNEGSGLSADQAVQRACSWGAGMVGWREAAAVCI